MEFALSVELDRLTKWQLFALLAESNPPEREYIAKDNTGKADTSHWGFITGVMREDGSGRAFLVNLKTDQGERTVFIRTID